MTWVTGGGNFLQSVVGMLLGAQLKSLFLCNSLEEKFMKRVGFFELQVSIQRRGSYLVEKHTIQPFDLFRIGLCNV